MVERETMETFLDGISMGFNPEFEEVKILMEAIGCKRKIPQNFWEDEKKGAYGFLGCYPPLSKRQLRQIREELIEAVCQRIELQKKLESGESIQVENYVRYLHVLTILGINEIARLPKVQADNLKYKIACNLWLLDDGSEKNWQTVQSVASCVTEMACK